MARVDGQGGFEIMRQAQTSKLTLWRCKQRNLGEGARASSGVTPDHYGCRLYRVRQA